MGKKDLLNSVPNAHVDLPRLRAGNVGLQVFAAYVPPSTDRAFAYVGERLDAIDAFARSDNRLALVETAGELQECLETDKIGVMLAVENGLAIENSLEKLEQLRCRKVRILTLVHSQHLSWVESCTGTERFVPDGVPNENRGLSNFGEQVLDAMNDLGLIPDLSHSSENAFWDVIRRSKKPVIASHSCAWSICAAPRNLKDDQLKALGDSGGLVGVNFFSAFLSEAFRQKHEAEKERNTSTPGTPVKVIDIHVPFSIIADHIDYMVKLAGEDCVALGSDFDGIPAVPEGVTGSDFYPVLEAELRSRGCTDTRIEKIFNKNFLRVLKEWE
jgi:membrane dipeptidase